VKEIVLRRPQLQRNLKTRGQMIQAIRRFFTERDYLEVETPCRMPSLIPEMHIDAIACGNWFLHPSPELCMKRLLAEGFEKIFQICKCFREGERGTHHLPEFTLLEWYRRNADYISLMDECQELITSVALAAGKGVDLVYQGEKINLQRPWERLSVREAFSRYGPLPLEDSLKEGSFDEVMVCHIEPNLGRNLPTFLYDYPVCPGALAKTKQGDPSVAERFELYIAGLEVANAFSELTDVQEHRLRFKEVQAYRSSINKPVYPISEKFLSVIETMPVAAGIALGVDRLAMIFTDSIEIGDVVSFTPDML
jgi:lysyl-tRNA synthetase class 2